jgi:hypothetical protein
MYSAMIAMAKMLIAPWSTDATFGSTSLKYPETCSYTAASTRCSPGSITV